MQALKGYRTYVIGFLMAVGVPGLTYLAGLDWTHIVNPNVAVFISGALMILLRSITTTPPGQSS